MRRHRIAARVEAVIFLNSSGCSTIYVCFPEAQYSQADVASCDCLHHENRSPSLPLACPVLNSSGSISLLEIALPRSTLGIDPGARCTPLVRCWQDQNLRYSTPYSILWGLRSCLLDCSGFPDLRDTPILSGRMAARNRVDGTLGRLMIRIFHFITMRP